MWETFANVAWDHLYSLLRHSTTDWPMVNLLLKDAMAINIVSKFCELLSSNLGVYAVKTSNFCRDASAIWRQSSFLTLPFPNGLEDRNFDFSRVIGNHLCTTSRNLVRFSSVTPEFNTSDFVQSASKIFLQVRSVGGAARQGGDK